MTDSQSQPDDVLEFVKNFLYAKNTSSDIKDIKFETDLVAFGIESLTLLALLISFETTYATKVDLDGLENNCFVISAETLASFIKS